MIDEILAAAIPVVQQSLSFLHHMQEIFTRDEITVLMMYQLPKELKEKVTERTRAKRSVRSWDWAPERWFWERTVADWPDDIFTSRFRMNRASFLALVELIREPITKKDTQLRDSIPAEKRVAVAMRYFASGAPIITIADGFGLGIKTVWTIIDDVVLVLCSLLPTPKLPETPDEMKLLTCWTT